jgi:RsiW-degrading membrane proteinase PrsW (M82 family)
MELGNLWTAIVWGILPGALLLVLVWALDRYEKEPLRLLAIALAFGAVAAPLVAFLIQKAFGIPTSIRAVSLIPESQLSAVSPLIEEIVRGLAILSVFFLVRHEIDDLYDGVLYGAVVGIGFAMAAGFASILATNAQVPATAGGTNSGLYAAAVSGFTHLFYGGVIGFALGWVRSAATPTVLGAAAVGTAAAYGLHIVHDYLPWWTAIDASGGQPSDIGKILGNVPNLLGVAGLAVVVIWSAARQAKIVSTQLRDEVEAGWVGADEYAVVTDPYKRFTTLARTLFGKGDDAWRSLRRLYATEIELAFRKHHRAHGGPQSRGPDENEYRRRIAEARAQLGTEVAR